MAVMSLSCYLSALPFPPKGQAYLFQGLLEVPRVAVLLVDLYLVVVGRDSHFWWTSASVAREWRAARTGTVRSEGYTGQRTERKLKCFGSGHVGCRYYRRGLAVYSL